MGALALTLGGSVAAASPAAADPAHCSGWGTPSDNYFAGGYSFKNGTYIRRGPFLDCDGVGLGYPSQGIDVHCVVYNGSTYWVYLRDTSTGKAGWSRLDTLNWDGSFTPFC
jgi:hypothetical protein